MKRVFPFLFLFFTPIVTQATDSISDLRQRRIELSSRVEVLSSWNAGTTLRLQEELKGFFQKIDAQLKAVEGNSLTLAQTKVLEGAMVQGHQIVDRFIETHKEAYQAATREFYDRQNFRIGVSFDRDPSERLRAWALHGIGLFRLNSWQQKGGMEIDQIDHTAQDVLNKLKMAEKWGLESILIVNIKPRPQVLEDFVFDQDLRGTLRPGFWGFNFNSAGLRNALQAAYKRWGEATKDQTNILLYQMNNEPFWSTAPSPILGYDPMTVGCSFDTWKHQIGKIYSSVEDWKRAFPDTTKNKRNHSLLNRKSVEKYIPWQSWDEFQFEPNRCRGLTFVEFLQARYENLDNLNQAWFGIQDRERWFTDWNEVFPPLPVDSREGAAIVTAENGHELVPEEWVTKTTSLPIPAAGDAPGWTDWTAFWGYHINDFLLENMRALKSGGVKAPVTTNSVTDHCISNYLQCGADSGLYPWTTSQGLDALGIDFYVIDQLQAYMMMLAGAAEGRDFYIHETSYQDPQSAQYVAMYSFAFGASACSFWTDKNDGDIPSMAYGFLLETARALDDCELQNASVPVTDGTLLMYSMDTLYLNDAIAGSPEQYLQTVQAMIACLARLQHLYTFHADLQLKNGVPSGTKVIVAPGAAALSDQTFLQIKKFVEAGGGLIASEDFGSVDAHGRLREEGQRAWLSTSRNVRLIDDKKLLNLRKKLSFKSANWPYNWVRLPMAGVVDEVRTKIADFVQSAVRYTDPSGQLAPVQAGLRRSAEATFVFVDPWASKVTVDLPGRYTQIENLFHQKGPLEIKEINGRTQIFVSDGPAILRCQ